MTSLKLISLLILATSAEGFVQMQTRGKLNTLHDAFASPDYESGCSSAGGLNHRHSANDWLHNVRSLPQSSVLQDIRNPVITIAVWSTFVSIAHRVLAGSASNVARKMAVNMCIGSTPHNFLVSSLGLLLVFRTNSAYQRFSEGRKIWSDILNVSRNISRMIKLYHREVGGERTQRIFNLVAAFPYLLRHHIRPGCLCGDPSVANDAENRLLLREPRAEVIETRQEGVTSTKVATVDKCWVDKRNLPWSLLEKSSLNHAANAQNRPLWVCDRISRQIMNIPYGPNFTSRERLTLLGQVEKLTNSIGECERIHQTAVPLNYARHSLRSLAIWLITLPFALVKDLGLLTGPSMAVMAWLLFGVYQIGYSIEDPFQGSLRLSVLCDAIRRDVLGERQNAFNMDWSEETDSMTDNLIPKPEVMMLQSLITPAVLQRNGTWGVVGLSTP